MATTGDSYPRDVHATILRQHAEIRARFRALDACSAPAASPLAKAYARTSLRWLAARFDAHLAFEEQALGPWLRELDAWGPVREAAMLTEHVEQRARLERACVSVEAEAADGIDVEHEISWLVVTFLEDMAREERELEELARLADGGLVDQMTG